MILLLIFIPLIFGICAWVVKRQERTQRRLLWSGALCHLLLTFSLLIFPASEGVCNPVPHWLGCDALSRIFLLITSVIFAGVAFHTLRWFPAERYAKETKAHPGALFSFRIFVPCLLIFLATMSLVLLARDFGLLWVAVEATTLFSAPLILFHRSNRSLEAMWKYLLICSVGIGLALLGTMLLAASGRNACTGLHFAQFAAAHNSLDPRWFKAAFICIAAGYGTKMGLAPFHTWLPDAHSEAPGTVSALLSGALLNCSFFGILRVCAVTPDSLIPFENTLLMMLGVFSLAVAAFFIIHQTDYKRMLAYSSVEHMGLLAIFQAAGLMDIGLIHLCSHSLIKMSLFLIAGNIILSYATRHIPDIGGLAGRIPRNAVLWLAGILMICGVPPSPLFFTELLLLAHLKTAVAALVLVLLFLVFAGMTGNMLKMVMGKDGNRPAQPQLSKVAEKLYVVPLTALLIVLGGGAILLYVLCFQGGEF